MDSPVARSSRDDAAPSLRAVGGFRSDVVPRLRAVVLLAGSVRETPFSRDLGRSPLDLPLRDGETVLQAWCRGAADLARSLGLAGLPVRVLVNRSAKLPELVPTASDIQVTAEFDPHELRGSAGVLRDIAEDFRPDDVILVGNAYQLVLEPLPDMVAAMSRAGGDVTLLTGDDQGPMGLKLVRRAALEPVKSKGFVDFNEQAIPLIAAQFDVRVAHCSGARAMSLRTLDGYMGALRRLHAPPGSEFDPLAEDWFRTFSLVEPGADVSASARVHDSVVLRRARVGAGAVVVRSLVCEGASVAAGEVVFDRVVAAPGAARARESAA